MKKDCACADATIKIWGLNGGKYVHKSVYLDSAPADGQDAMRLTASKSTTQWSTVWLVFSDYKNYVVGKACDRGANANEKGLWFVLGSQHSLDALLWTLALSHIKEADPDADPNALQRISQDPCPDIPDEPVTPPSTSCLSPNLVEDFDIAKYSGGWYDVLGSDDVDQGTCECVSHVLSSTSHTLAYFEKTYDGSRRSFTTELGSVKATGPRLVVSSGPAGERRDYRVLGTDYVSYSVVYSCDDTKDGDGGTVRVLSRGVRLPSRSRAAVDEALALVGRSMVDQYKSCDRGCRSETCPPVLDAAEELDMVQFGGPWYARMRTSGAANPVCEVFLHTESSGSRLFVTRTDVGASAAPAVSEVVPAAMYSLDGRYVRAADGGGARAGGAGVVWSPAPTQYSILGVEYDAWAVVATCTETPGAAAVQEFVILSRSPTDAHDNDTHFGKVVEVLRKHDLTWSDFDVARREGCERLSCLPEPVARAADLEWPQFLGDWYVMEEPRGASSGFCTRHTFQQSQQRCLLTISQRGSRHDLRTVGQYVLVQDPGYKRKFTTSTTTKPAGVFQDFWILDTDYRTYAVTYSCTVQDGGRLSARTWILTRTPGAALDRDAATSVYEALVRAAVDVRGLSFVDHPSYCVDHGPQKK
ncbi:hypothetical protein ONE63_008557 [Megalurothrips usitatus]|uniref:Lipocalin/cytosolic fatty-acid binding domain-containing protein n=1 Tax=Megalurothrips usitatus TaxID=439358 RepID=A0AAV7XPW0_9NEOP|nr:hypothetical protein ONE63_008557 [Megalurothrips usitatus]